MTEPRVVEVPNIEDENEVMHEAFPALPSTLHNLELITQDPSNWKGKGKERSNGDPELDSGTQARNNHGPELDSRTKAESSRGPELDSRNKAGSSYGPVPERHDESDSDDDEAVEWPPDWTHEQVAKTPPYLLPLESDKLGSYEKLLTGLAGMDRPTSKKIFAKIVRAGIWDTSHKLWSNKLAGQHVIHPDSVSRLVEVTRQCGVDINEDCDRRWYDLATKAYAVCNSRVEGAKGTPLKGLREVEEGIMGKENVGQFAPNGYVDGPPDLKRNQYEDMDNNDNETGPLNLTLIHEYHRQTQQQVWLPLLLKIWNNMEKDVDAMSAEERQLNNQVGQFGLQNVKFNLPFSLGMLPVPKMMDIWRRVKKAQIGQEVAKQSLRQLWARHQFADGLCKLPPQGGGAYPKVEDLQDEYRARIARDANTKQHTSLRSNLKGTGHAGRNKSEQSEQRERTTRRANEYSAQPQHPNSFILDPRDIDVEMNNAPQQPRQALTPINPNSSQVVHHQRRVQILAPSRRRDRTFRPGFTSSGDEIIAFGTTERNETDDAGARYRRTMRNYVVRKGACYTLQPESACGGPEIWEMLPNHMKDTRKIGQFFDKIPDRRQLPYMRHGISWLAMAKCSLDPTRLPQMACGIYWQPDGQTEMQAVIWRYQLQKVFGREEADAYIASAITPEGQEDPPDIWTAIKWYQPSIEPVRMQGPTLRAAPLALPQPDQGNGNQPDEVSRLKDEVASLSMQLRQLQFGGKPLVRNSDSLNRNATAVSQDLEDSAKYQSTGRLAAYDDLWDLGSQSKRRPKATTSREHSAIQGKNRRAAPRDQGDLEFQGKSRAAAPRDRSRLQGKSRGEAYHDARDWEPQGRRGLPASRKVVEFDEESSASELERSGPQGKSRRRARRDAGHWEPQGTRRRRVASRKVVEFEDEGEESFASELEYGIE